MKLSLSVRIVEAPCKTRLAVPLEELVSIARETGYDAICMRASAVGIGTPRDRLREARRRIEAEGLRVSMVTADFDVPLNNERGPNALRDIRPSLDVAEALGADLVRVCLKRPEDVPFARAAADEAASHGIRLAHQCHTSSLFEEVEPMLGVLAAIGRANFGLTYEPANLMLCGQSYGRDSLTRLRPHLLNVYAQNHRLAPNGPEVLTTYCRGDVRYLQLDPWERGGVDYAEVFRGLQEVDYNGYFTIHQARGITTADAARTFARRCAEFVRSAAKD